MNGIISMIVYAAVLVIFYAVILSQKGEPGRMKTSLKSQDWITFFSCIFGGVLLGTMIVNSGISFPADIGLIVLSVFFAGLLVFALVRKKRTGRPMVQLMGDERMEIIYAKSARNALFVTYLTLFINSIVTDEKGLNTTWMLIMLAGGLSVLIVSVFVYYYKKS